MRTALLLVDHGSIRREANDLLADVARLVRERSGLAVVEHAHMDLAEPTIAQGFAACVAQGAELVIVHPYFLAPGRHSTRDIPRLVAEAAARSPHVPFRVTEPLGLHPRLVDVVLERAGVGPSPVASLPLAAAAGGGPHARVAH